MSLGWYLLSIMFWHPAPNRDSNDYSTATVARTKPEVTMARHVAIRFIMSSFDNRDDGGGGGLLPRPRKKILRA
jgi:hypothetical protein